MWKALATLQKNLVWSIPISMAAGVIFGYLFDAAFLKQFIIPVTFIMVYPMMVTLNVQTIFKGQDYKLQIKPKFPPFSALGVTLIAFVAMALKAKHIIANPGDIVIIFIPLIVFYLVTYIFLSFFGRIFFKREDAIAMVFGVVMRDLSIALAIAMTAFGRQGLTIALLIALAYVIQIQSAAWYVRFVDKAFGKANAPVHSAGMDAEAPVLEKA